MEILENAGQAQDKGIIGNVTDKIADVCDSNAIQTAKQKLEEVVTEAKFYAKHLEEVAADRATKAAVCAVETAKEHPAMTAGVIAILGTLTGFLVARSIYKK